MILAIEQTAYFCIARNGEGRRKLKLKGLYASRVENDERTNAGLDFTLLQLICHNDC